MLETLNRPLRWGDTSQLCLRERSWRERSQPKLQKAAVSLPDPRKQDLEEKLGNRSLLVWGTYHNENKDLCSPHTMTRGGQYVKCDRLIDCKGGAGRSVDIHSHYDVHLSIDIQDSWRLIFKGANFCETPELALKGLDYRHTVKGRKAKRLCRFSVDQIIVIQVLISVYSWTCSSF